MAGMTAPESAPVGPVGRGPLPPDDAGRLDAVRAFFAARAATWDTRFGEDLPAYEAAVAEAGFAPGGLVADIGCGTGRALPALRAAVGPAGGVVALDVTPQMLAEVRARGRDAAAAPLLADATRLPIADGVLAGVFAAGYVSHLPDPVLGLRELARATRPGGVLALFHPSGRAALAARHRRVLAPDEPLAPAVLGPLLAASGWALEVYDDAADRFYARASRA